MPLGDCMAPPQMLRWAAKNTAISASEIRTERPRRCTGKAPESMSLRTLRVDVLKRSATSLIVRSFGSVGFDARLFRRSEIWCFIFVSLDSRRMRSSSGSLHGCGAEMEIGPMQLGTRALLIRS